MYGRGMANTRGKLFDDHVNLLLTKEMKTELSDLAWRSRRSLSDYIRLVLEDNITKSKKLLAQAEAARNTKP